jgi:hypothetical protein
MLSFGERGTPSGVSRPPLFRTLHKSSRCEDPRTVCATVKMLFVEVLNAQLTRMALNLRFWVQFVVPTTSRHDPPMPTRQPTWFRVQESVSLSMVRGSATLDRDPANVEVVTHREL